MGWLVPERAERGKGYRTREGMKRPALTAEKWVSAGTMTAGGSRGRTMLAVESTSMVGAAQREDDKVSSSTS